MAIQKVRVEEFLSMSASHPVLDVRSPGEYTHAHIPGAHSFPLFTDEERKVVGTAYKQQSREAAIKIGLDYFGAKMRSMVEDAEVILEAFNKKHKKNDNTVLVHCWRGGMRSAGVAWLLDLYGFKVYTLAGGYKAFRQWALAQFELPYPFRVIGGYTGSGKTALLHQLEKEGQAIIDLEDIAKHKGSAFGEIKDAQRPTQEMFDNLLAIRLQAVIQKLQGKEAEMRIWIEDESQRIGDINMHGSFWKAMRTAPLYFLDIPFEERLDNIVKEYGKQEKEKLINSIVRIQKRLGGLDAKNAINHLLDDNIKECFRILLRYYDKAYAKSLHNRDELEKLLHTIPSDTTDAIMNSKKILEHKQAV